MSVRTRPEALFQLFTPTTSIKGVGPRISDFISKLAGPNIIDLLWHLPTGIIDRRYSPDLTEAKAARVVSLTLRIDKHIPLPLKIKESHIELIVLIPQVTLRSFTFILKRIIYERVYLLARQE